MKGTYRSDRHGDVDAEAQPDAAVIAPPEWLDGVALEVWEDIAPRLLRLGLFSELDPNTLAQYCEAWADFRQAKETIDREGITTFTGAGSLAKHPAVAVKENAAERIRKFGALFGLSPADRSGLPVIKKEKAGIASRNRA